METKEITKLYKYIKNGEEVKKVAERLELKDEELYGLVEYMNLEGYDIHIYEENGKLKLKKKNIYKKERNLKENVEDLEEVKLCFVSDTHFGTSTQQLTLLNKVYKEAYLRGIDTVLHLGDLVDGDYRNKRPAHPYTVFLQGFDQQCEYVIENYPSVKGLTTYFIQGSHDDTHFLNGGATMGKWIMKSRNDMFYVGQDDYIYKAGTKNNVEIEMHHPGGGSAKALSYNPQEKINRMEPDEKPRVLAIGHYHKSYYMFYRNVHALLVPCFMDKSGFMIRNSLSNIIGAYFVTMYINKDGEIQYFIPDELLFKGNQIIQDDYKTCKKLVIK